MTKTQALRAVELIGGYRKTANMVKNLNGEPIHEGKMQLMSARNYGLVSFLPVRLLL